jgi:hypothetical protein
MHTSKLVIILGMLALSSCATAPNVPTLPEEAQKVSFTHTQETFRRGLKAAPKSYATSRESAIIEAIYSIDCLSGGSLSAQTNFSKAKNILKDAFVEAPVFHNNPRERGHWRRAATYKIFDATDCVVRELEYGKVNTDKVDVMLWVLENDVPLK